MGSSRGALGPHGLVAAAALLFIEYRVLSAVQMAKPSGLPSLVNSGVCLTVELKIPRTSNRPLP